MKSPRCVEGRRTSRGIVEQGHINDDAPYSCQLEILGHEVCLLQSVAVWHVLAICSVSRLGEYHLRGGEYMLVCAHRGARMLRAAVEVVAEYVDSEAFARAFVMLERSQGGMGSSSCWQEGCPVEALSSC